MTREWTQPHSFDPGYDPEMDQPDGPTDQEMLSELDAYGHLEYAVAETYPDDPERESECLIATDFLVFIHPDRDVLVAYHVVYDMPGSIDTVEEGVFSADELGDLDKNSWFPGETLVDGVNESLLFCEAGFGFISWKDVEKVRTRWTKDLQRKVKQAQDWLESGKEIPISCQLT